MKNIIKIGLAIVTAAMITTSAFSGEKTAEKKVKPYALDVCVVSGEKLNAMGNPVKIVYQDREIKFCCAGCEGIFKKAPEKYLKKIEELEKAKAKK